MAARGFELTGEETELQDLVGQTGFDEEDDLTARAQAVIDCVHEEGDNLYPEGVGSLGFS
jgi:hypothetical protein